MYIHWFCICTEYGYKVRVFVQRAYVHLCERKCIHMSSLKGPHVYRYVYSVVVFVQSTDTPSKYAYLYKVRMSVCAFVFCGLCFVGARSVVVRCCRGLLGDGEGPQAAKWVVSRMAVYAHPTTEVCTQLCEPGADQRQWMQVVATATTSVAAIDAAFCASDGTVVHGVGSCAD